MEYALIPAEDVRCSMFLLRIAAAFSDDAAEREAAKDWLLYLEGLLFEAELESWPFCHPHTTGEAA
jgi:hypothetical protein